MREFETQFMDLKSNQIKVDPVYQRPISDGEIKDIVKNWNPNVRNEPKVSFRDGTYYVFDGQHTIVSSVAKNGGKPVTIRCKVFFGLTQLDEAELFLLQNGSARAVRPIQRMHTRYKLGEQKIVAIVKAVESTGITVGFNGYQKNGQIICASSLEKAYDMIGIVPFQSMMHTIAQAWHGDKVSLSGKMVDGMTIFYKKYYGLFNEKELIDDLEKVYPSQIVSSATSKAGTPANEIARTICDIYNKGRRTKKLAM